MNEYTSQRGQNSESVVLLKNQMINEESIFEEHLPPYFDPKIRAFYEVIIQSDLPTPEKFLLSLLLTCGLRVSEIADPSRIKFYNDYVCAVYCKKQKLFRTVNCFVFSRRKLTKYEVIKIQNWYRSRQYYYRIMSAYFFGVESQRIYNQSVCHAPRNILAQQKFDETGDIKEVMKLLHLSSMSAAVHYLSSSQLSKFRNISQ